MKLVRDHMTLADSCEVMYVDKHSSLYRRLLAEKLVEEAIEFRNSARENEDFYGSMEELADVQQVVFALADTLHSGYDGLENVRLAKADERGVFDMGRVMFLVEKTLGHI